MSTIRAGLVLSRTPIVSPKLSKFEDAYLKYQNALERRLMWTFPSWFYFKKGTLSSRRFHELQRGPSPKYRGVIYPNGAPDVRFNRDRRFAQEVQLPRGLLSSEDSEGANVGIQPLPRITEADETNNVKSLSRALDQTLYLLIRSKELNNEWRFPSFTIGEEDTSLHERAEQGLRELGGENINTHTVSSTPAMCLDGENALAQGETEFLIKSHILHGEFAPNQDDIDFAWLTKDEIAERAAPNYYERVRILF